MMDPAALPLRDIHLPAPPSWWPPGPGWLWLALGLLCLALLAGVLYYLHRRRLASLSHRAAQALHELRLEQLRNPSRERLLRDLSALLRRVALSVWPPESVAPLCGEDWLRFLDQQDPERRFTRGVGRVLAAGPYQRGVQFDERALLALASDWLGKATVHKASAPTKAQGLP